MDLAYGSQKQANNPRVLAHVEWTFQRETQTITSQVNNIYVVLVVSAEERNQSVEERWE